MNGVCETDSDISIVNHNELKRYEGFSPNGDGDNDYLIFQGLVDAEFSISFFNALGRTVRTFTHETISELDYIIKDEIRDWIDPEDGGDEMVVWDGKAKNGTMVPPGTYYYVVSIKMDQKDHLGNIISTDHHEEKDYVVVQY